MIEAVDMFLERVSGDYRFVTVPDLLRHGQPRRRNWYLKADVDWLNGLKGQENEPRRYSRGASK